MTNLFNFSTFLLAVLLLNLQVTKDSCANEKRRRNILYPCVDTALTTHLLTSNSWKLREYIGVEGNDKVYYVRGSSNNNVSYDYEYVTFNDNGTGGYYDPNADATSPLTWSFANSSKTKVVIRINFPTGLEIVTWDHIFYDNQSLIFAQYWTKGNINSHTQNIRIPRSYLNFGGQILQFTFDR